MVQPVQTILLLGGSVTAGLGIYDTMQYIKPPVATWCVGQACSMGAFLLASGEKDHRHCLPHSRVMIHQPHGYAGVCLTATLQGHGRHSYMDMQGYVSLPHSGQGHGTPATYICKA